jgi:hypothetical protein
MVKHYLSQAPALLLLVLIAAYGGVLFFFAGSTVLRAIFLLLGDREFMMSAGVTMALSGLALLPFLVTHWRKHGKLPPIW